MTARQVRDALQQARFIRVLTELVNERGGLRVVSAAMTKAPRDLAPAGASLYGWLNGKNMPSGGSLNRLAEFFNVSPEVFDVDLSSGNGLDTPEQEPAPQVARGRPARPPAAEPPTVTLTIGGDGQAQIQIHARMSVANALALIGHLNDMQAIKIEPDPGTEEP